MIELIERGLVGDDLAIGFGQNKLRVEAGGVEEMVEQQRVVFAVAVALLNDVIDGLGMRAHRPKAMAL